MFNIGFYVVQFALCVFFVIALLIQYTNDIQFRFRSLMMDFDSSRDSFKAPALLWELLSVYVKVQNRLSRLVRTHFIVV